MDLDVTDAEVTIHDNGGARSGQERRKSKQKYQGVERRSGEDRRKLNDRRSVLTRRQAPDRRIKTPCWDGSRIERRDAFR
jgi:hypothetical protein